MNSRQARAAQRIRSLIEEGEGLAQLERNYGDGIQYIREKAPLCAWLVKVENIVRMTFGTGGAHYGHLAPLLKSNPEHAYQVLSIVGILTGALDDLEGGFLRGQEHLIAGEILDSVLEEARLLNGAGFKDPAAILARVVVEDELRRLSREADLPDKTKATALNDALREKGQYPKPRWRMIQTWLDIGNAAAHGQFDEYKGEDVDRMISDVERFLAEGLQP